MLMSQLRANSLLMKTDTEGWTMMQRLIQKMPEVAKVR